MEVGSGAWSWFADPRAVASGGLLYVGFIDGAGDVRVAAVDRGAGAGDDGDASSGLGVDDHHNPVLLLRAEGRLQAFYSGHTGPALFFVSARASGCGAPSSAWGRTRRERAATPIRTRFSWRPRTGGSICSGAAGTSIRRSRRPPTA